MRLIRFSATIGVLCGLVILLLSVISCQKDDNGEDPVSGLYWIECQGQQVDENIIKQNNNDFSDNSFNESTKENPKTTNG
ncbi:MAG: hypothetical protein HN352_05530 [Bacteroidetes bacterium]|jgi:hypothetical protein|nr:hypothetical protein [Bacteroidota bacterium]MBT3747522.1 hypothetical protein [Bacteroidota bacterium]MBT4399654.1 hypothetical protein [Bacteroidota bacterium]MBT4409541.1 hypothetical protein [Bacteroidota bacterium]MBT5427668.1 hypothetical protein [Bacteroidota bacterium]